VPEGFDEQMINDTLVQAFDREGKPMVEAVQQVLADADLWTLDPVLFLSDPGGLRMRRKLAALIAAEQATGTA
jgi:vanillate O-demethylase monooxygenase subunit